MLRIVAHLLSDGQEPHTVFRKLAHIKLKLEMIAEEAREAVNYDDIEGCGLGGLRFDHALEFGPAVVGRGSAGFDIGFDELVAPRRAIGFALTALVGNGDIMLRLPRR
ncbi:MAG TPA: hypothetical protein VGF56_01355 [Rhizomicrobium sp.]